MTNQTINQLKGEQYEVFIKNFLENENEKAWLWKDIPESILREAGLLRDWNLHRLIRKENKINSLPDLGTDILFKSNNEYKLIQCKNYSLKNNVTIEDLAGFYAMMMHYRKNGILYYTSKLSSNLKLLKPNNEIEFIRKEFMNEDEKILIENKIKNNFEPYYYQKEAYEELKNHNRSILNLPCGMGKTFASIMLSKEYDNIIIISPLIAYAKQNLERFENQFENYNTILISSEGLRDKDEILKILNKNKKNILSFTYKSVDILLQIIDSLKNIFIIIDEFHNLSKNDLLDNETDMNKILTSPLKILFMSATPRFFNMDEYDNKDIFGDKIYAISMAKGISENYICDYDIYLPYLVNKNNLNDISNEISIQDFPEDLLLKGKFILRGMMETGSKKCIIYLKNQEEVKNMVIILNKLNEYFFIDLYTDYIISDNDSNERKSILNNFSNYEGYSIICSVNILNECIDIPSCDSIFITYPSESKISNIQRMCRANRKNKNNIHKKSKVFLWCDEYSDITIFISQLKEFDENFIENKVSILNVYENEGQILERDKKEYELLYKNLDHILISIKKFGYGIDSWKKNLNELKEFIKSFNKLPSLKIQNEKYLSHWVYDQNNHFKKNRDIMKLLEIKELWNEFISENKILFISLNQTWRNNLDKLEEFISENNRLPTQASDEERDTVLLAKWIIRNNDEYNKNEKAMKNEEIRLEWIQFKDKYSKLFNEKNDLWKDNLTKIDEFIKRTNLLPVENKNRKEEYDMRIWLKTQMKIYKKNKFENDNEKRVMIENFLSKYSELLSVKSNFEIWIEKYEELIQYIIENKSLPKEKIKISTNITEDKRKELEFLKSLGIWKSNAVQNAKIDFNTNIEDIDISKLSDSEKEKHIVRLKKYNDEKNHDNEILSKDYSKLNKKEKNQYDKIKVLFRNSSFNKILIIL